MERVHRRLYRALLRQATQFDEYPAVKLLLYRKHTLLRTRHHKANEAARYYQLVLLRQLFPEDGRRLLEPEICHNLKLKDIVRAEYRKDRSQPSVSSLPGMGDNSAANIPSLVPQVSSRATDSDSDDWNDEDDATDDAVLRARAEAEAEADLNAVYTTNARVDAGFACLRNLSSVWSTYKASVSEMQRQQYQQQKLVQPTTSKARSRGRSSRSATNASETDARVDRTTDQDYEAPVQVTNTLEPGMLLLAHPLVKGPLSRSVILLLEHSEAHGSYGIVINAPTEHTLKNSVVNLPADLLDAFGNCSVSFGGMVRRLQYVHDIPDLGAADPEGSVPDAQTSDNLTANVHTSFEIPFCERPMYCGGSVTAALQAVKKDPTLISRFRFFAGKC